MWGHNNDDALLHSSKKTKVQASQMWRVIEYEIEIFQIINNKGMNSLYLQFYPPQIFQKGGWNNAVTSILFSSPCHLTAIKSLPVCIHELQRACRKAELGKISKSVHDQIICDLTHRHIIINGMSSRLKTLHNIFLQNVLVGRWGSRW